MMANDGTEPRAGGLGPSRDTSLRALLISALEDSTQCKVVEEPQGELGPGLASPDLALALKRGNRRDASVAAVFLRHAYPRDIRAALWTLDGYKRALPADADPILLVAADSLSPGSKQLLRERGVAYFERAGTLFVRWRHWLVNIERPPSEAPPHSDAFALFTDAREKVIHALLKHGGKWLTGTDLAELSGTSSYTCSVVLNELEKREWCETTGAGQTLRRRLVEPQQLLDAWSQHWIQRKETRSHWYYLPTGSAPVMEQVCECIGKADVSLPWAFTGAAPANILAPLLTSVDVVTLAVPPGGTETIARALKAKPAEKGANVTIVERRGAGMQFLDSHGGRRAPFTSPFVMFMDLLDGRGRNKELAEALREKLMGSDME